MALYKYVGLVNVKVFSFSFQYEANERHITKMKKENLL